MRSLQNLIAITTIASEIIETLRTLATGLDHTADGCIFISLSLLYKMNSSSSISTSYSSSS
jgi:hypothetical protein